MDITIQQEYIVVENRKLKIEGTGLWYCPFTRFPRNQNYFVTREMKAKELWKNFGRQVHGQGCGELTLFKKKKKKNSFVASVEGFLRTLSKLFLHLSLYMIIIFMVFLVPITCFFRGKFL